MPTAVDLLGQQLCCWLRLSMLQEPAHQPHNKYSSQHQKQASLITSNLGSLTLYCSDETTGSHPV